MLGWLGRVFGGARTAEAEDPEAARARNPDPAERQAAAGRLAAVPHLWAGEVLLNLLRDPHPGVRAAAREALRARGVLAAPELLTGLNHADVAVAAVAADLLGE